jgi:uncharacterized RDD family membrane protein YckC
MAKQRFRDIKQGNIQDSNTNEEKAKQTKKSSKKPEFPYYATAGMKVKAFLTDSFMLVMPIMYVVIYLVMDSREGFAAHKIEGWLYILIPLIIVQTIFMFKTGQTPGFRAYNITLIDESTKEKPSLFTVLFRNTAAVLSIMTFVGWIVMFFRKDSKTLHDYLSNTACIIKYDKKP